MAIEISVVDAPVAALGECPVWSQELGSLVWADIDGRTIHRHHLTTGATESRPLEGRPGSFVLTDEPGRLVVAVEHELVSLDWERGVTTTLLALEAPGTGNRLNDGRCDPAGRYVVGSMYADTNAGRTTGMLHQVGGGSATTLGTGIGIANGLAFDAERGLMYFADTPTERVVVSDYDAASGEVSAPRGFFDYAEVPGKPDGACLDADGCYWSASVYGWALLRITPDGAVDRRVELPVEKPSMPCFGGADLDVCFVTTIGAGGTVPSASGNNGVEPGATLAITGLGVRGLPEPRFAG